MAQTIIQVSTSQNYSLRDKIARDQSLEQYSFKVDEMKKNTRSNGWLKIHPTDKTHGAINVKWDSDTRILNCRVITKGGDPSLISGRFVYYLISQFGSSFDFINIIPK